MNKLLLTLSLSLVALPVYADEMSPTKGTDLPAPRTSAPQPTAAPAEMAQQTKAAAPAAAPAMTAKAAPAARADNIGWFAGVGIGISQNRDYSCDDCGTTTSLDDSGLAYKLFGGYRLHRNFALSAGYVDLADTKASGTGPVFNDRLKADGFYAAAHGILPVTDKIDVFATLGAFRWNQKVKYSDTGWSGSGSFNGTDVMYGLGASYAFGPAKLQAEWNRFNNVGSNDVDLGHIDDYDLFTVNLVYQF